MYEKPEKNNFVNLKKNSRKVAFKKSFNILPIEEKKENIRLNLTKIVLLSFFCLSGKSQPDSLN
jgi:hypothetical protein